MEGEAAGVIEHLPGLALVVQPEVHESGVIRQLARCHRQGGQRNARQLQADEIADFLHRGHLALLHKLFAQVVQRQDRKSTRLNSSHVRISYAVFCLKKKTTKKETNKQ